MEKRIPREFLDQEARYNEHEGNCGPSYDYKYYDQRYGTGTLNYHYTRLNGYERFSYGGSLFGGVIKEQEAGSPDLVTHTIIGVHPYLNYGRRWIGVGIGTSIGLLNYFPAIPLMIDLSPRELKPFLYFLQHPSGMAPMIYSTWSTNFWMSFHPNFPC